MHFSNAFIAKAVSHTAFFIFLMAALAGCNKTADEDRIQTLINKMTATIESGNPADISQYLHDDFQANRYMDTAQVKRVLQMYNLQHNKISLTIISSVTTIDAVYTDKATTALTVIVTGFSGHGVPEDGSIRAANLEWRKESDWKLLKVSWE